MPKFTEGEWYYEGAENGGRIIANDDRKTIIHIPPCNPYNEQAISDARLMAKSKKMYEALKELTDENNFEAFDGAIEVMGCSPISGTDFMKKVRAILSSIEEE